MDFKNFLSKNKELDILSNIPDGVLLLDEKGIVEKANEKSAEMFQYELIAKTNFNDLIENGFELVKQAVSNKKSAVGKVKLENVKNLYFEITAKEVQGFFVLVLRDVTQNYKKITNLMIEQKSSKRNNKDKNNFLVKLSNEFKSPIQSIVGFSQGMLDGLGGPMSEKQDKYIRIINKNSVDALNFINKIIELAKIESNLFEYNNQIFDIINASQVVFKEFETNNSDKNINWVFDSSKIIQKSIFSDEGVIKTILKNILEISLTMTEMGSISLSISNPEREFLVLHGIEVPEKEEDFIEKNYLRFEITDTGCGYSETELEVLFEPYLQLDKPNRKNILKSVALASVKNLVKHLKGKIWVDSIIMQGCSYNIVIPVVR